MRTSILYRVASEFLILFERASLGSRESLVGGRVYYTRASWGCIASRVLVRDESIRQAGAHSTLIARCGRH